VWNQSSFTSKVFIVKIATGVIAFLLLAALGVSRAAPMATSAWHYPNDRKAVRSQEPPKPYKARGLPDGVVAVHTTYRRPGFDVRNPYGGIWHVDGVAKLYFRGKMFAIVGSTNGHEVGFIGGFVIYDEDGNGSFENVVELNDKNGPIDFHLPNWVIR